MAHFMASLTPPRRQLVREMQRINFGRIESLKITEREPELDPMPPRVREHKFSSENGPRPEVATGDFLLKQQVLELFTFFDQMRNGVIEVLEIKHGLPFRMDVREVSA